MSQNDQVFSTAAGLLREAYEGADSSFFTDAEKGGLLTALRGITATRASVPTTGDGPSVAAHAEHLRWSLANVNATVRGEPWNPDWSASWRTQRVNGDEWDALQAALKREYETTLETMRSLENPDPMVLTGVFATVAHAAYHLGAIRAVLRGDARA